MTGPDLSPVMSARLTSQARAVQRAAATYRKIVELQPRFGWPIAIVEGFGGRPMPFTPPAADFERAARAFECHPALDPKNAIGMVQS